MPSSGCRQHARQHQSPFGIYLDECYSYSDWMMAGVKAKYWAVIGADKRADNSPNWGLATRSKDCAVFEASAS